MINNRSLFLQEPTPPLPAGYGQTYQPYTNEVSYVRQCNDKYQQVSPSRPQPPDVYFQPQYIETVTHKPVPEPPIRQTQSVMTPRTKSNIIDWVVCLLPIFYGIAVLVCVIALLQTKAPNINPEEAHNVLSKLQDNLRVAPIVSIVNSVTAPAKKHMLNHFIEHQAAGTCPKDYVQAQLGTWDGVESGCLCDDGEQKSKLYCYSHFSSEKCKKVSSKSPVDINVWGGKTLCVQRASEWKWVSGSECQAEWKMCAGNICVPKDNQCPITTLTAGAASAKSITLGTKSFASSSTGTSPIIGFQLLPGKSSKPCDDKLNPPFESEKYYPLARNPEKGCGEFGSLDHESVSLDNAPFKTIATENNLATDFDNIPFYKNYLVDTDTESLNAISRIVIKNVKECGSVHPDEISQLSRQSQIVQQSTNTIVFLILVVVVILLIAAVVLYLTRKSQFQWIDIATLKQARYFCILAIIIALLAIILGAIYLHYVDGKNGLKANDKAFTQYLQSECFENTGIIKAITQVQKFGLQSYQSYTWVSYLFIVSIIFIILLIVALLYQQHSEKELFSNPWRKRQQA